MIITDLKNTNKFHLAPERGYILAVFDDSVIFERYQKTGDGIAFRGCEEKKHLRSQGCICSMKRRNTVL